MKQGSNLGSNLGSRGSNQRNKEIPAKLAICTGSHSFFTAHLPHDLHGILSYLLIAIACKVLHKVLYYPSQLLCNTEVLKF